MASELNVGGITTTGNVEVGTASGTSPAYWNSFLNVQNNAATSDNASITITSGNAGYAGLHFGDTENGRIGQIAYNNTNNSLLLTSNNSTRLTIDNTGLATFTNGIAVTTGGIKFPATQSASADANTLDDYEEGTWTATMAGASSVGNTTGYYTKVGRLVTFSYYSGSVTSTAVGATISGLPFAPTIYQTFTAAHNTWAPLSSSGYITHTSGNLILTNTGEVNGATATAGSGKYIMVSGTYFV